MVDKRSQLELAASGVQNIYEHGQKLGGFLKRLYGKARNAPILIDTQKKQMEVNQLESEVNALKEKIKLKKRAKELEAEKKALIEEKEDLAYA